MPYFVWVDHNGEGHSQKWSQNHTMDFKEHPHVRAENKHQISDRDFVHRPMKNLEKDYPFVPIKSD